MDEYNCTQFWGLSPAVDFLSLLERQPSPGDTQEPLRVLQSAVYDCRHTLQTLGRAPRHAAALGARPVHFYMHEEEPEVLARHLLLLAIFFDHNVTAKDRAELLLEVHGNALLRCDWDPIAYPWIVMPVVFMPNVGISPANVFLCLICDSIQSARFVASGKAFRSNLDNAALMPLHYFAENCILSCCLLRLIDQQYNLRICRV